MPFDSTLAHFLNGLTGRSPIFDKEIVFFASYLPWVLLAVFVTWLFFFSSAAMRDKLYIFGVAMLSGLIARAGVTELIRAVYHRPRPFMTYPEIHPLFTDSAWSFPSGHSTFFFAIATAVFFYNRTWGSILFAGTLVVTVSRVIAGVHYPSDIVGGMLIGMLTAYIVSRLAKARQAGREP